jgi:predicted transcriptional regulator
VSRMRSLRLEDELDARVREAASVEGSSVSEFLRQAASERAERVLSTDPAARLADVIGLVRSGGGRAARSGKVFAELLAEEHRAQGRRDPR